MNTKDNQRSRLTKMLMKQSYMQLMHEKPTGKITVKDICQYAQVNRSTFYLHYGEPNDLLIELEDEAIAMVQESLTTISSLTEDFSGAQQYLTSFLHYVQKNEELFRTFLVDNSDPHFRRKLINVSIALGDSAFQVEIPEEIRRTVFVFLVSGSIEVLTDWIRSDFALSEKEVGELLFKLCEGGLWRAFAAVPKG